MNKLEKKTNLHHHVMFFKSSNSVPEQFLSKRLGSIARTFE